MNSSTYLSSIGKKRSLEERDRPAHITKASPLISPKRSASAKNPAEDDISLQTTGDIPNLVDQLLKKMSSNATNVYSHPAALGKSAKKPVTEDARPARYLSLSSSCLRDLNQYLQTTLVN